MINWLSKIMYVEEDALLDDALSFVTIRFNDKLGDLKLESFICTRMV